MFYNFGRCCEWDDCLKAMTSGILLAHGKALDSSIACPSASAFAFISANGFQLFFLHLLNISFLICKMQIMLTLPRFNEDEMRESRTPSLARSSVGLG